MVETVLFFVFGAAAIAGALTMVASRNPVYSALGLMLTMFSIAVFYVSNSAHFVAVIQVIIYAGAVMTLFLFVIMLIGVDRAEDRTESIPFQRPLGLLLLLGLAAGVVAAGARAWVTGPSAGPDDPQGTVEAIGEQLFTRWVLPFEITALLLIVAAAGAIGLAHFRGGEEDA
ncbi:MAG TPA: NADH-quinone oxidoreductase subunit J [Acidimicrobiia bacterium]|nr:NADH-quinone oxidoreductase subunit J [Acidimicrobiia bacterium]